MERTKTEHLIFEVLDVSPEFKWPADTEVQCVGKRNGGNKVDIVRGPNCTQKDVSEMMEQFENDWRELNGMEVPADGLRFH